MKKIIFIFYQIFKKNLKNLEDRLNYSIGLEIIGFLIELCADREKSDTFRTQFFAHTGEVKPRNFKY